MAKSPEERKADVRRAANAVSSELDCDILLFNFSFELGLDYAFLKFLKKRQKKKDHLLFFLVTEGGDADAAYRVARYIQDAYKKITIAVPGWCKSAGTLVCTGANELIIFDAGELGPVDVQIAKADEVGERSSGLAAVAAFEKLQEEAFKMFERHLSHIINEIPGRITFKTAADISTQLVIGAMRDIFAKIEPMSVGEDYRSGLIAGEYARRLNLYGRNLQDRQEPRGLDMLLSGYPSHRFVIDRREASKLFLRVSEPSEKMINLAEQIGTDAYLPRNPHRNQMPCLEFLDDEASEDTKPKTKAAAKRTNSGTSGKARRAGPGDVPGSVPAGVEQDARRKPAA